MRKAAAFGDLRASRAASCRSAEIHGLGQRLHAFDERLQFLQRRSKIFAIKRYMEKRLDAARENGGSGLIAELVRVEKEGGRISRNEMVAMLFLLLLAGHETTTHLISGSVRELLRNPELRDPGWRKGGGARPRRR